MSQSAFFAIKKIGWTNAFTDSKKDMFARLWAHPDKYRKAVARAVNMCTEKRHIEENIAFDTAIHD